MRKRKFTVGLIVFLFAVLLTGGFYLWRVRQGQVEILVAQAAEDLKADWNWDYFDDYASWPSSSLPKDPDPVRYMLQMINAGGNVIHPGHFVDINGDGLVDLLYYLPTEEWGLFYNNGSGAVEPVYLCKWFNSVWYGDCADVK